MEKLAIVVPCYNEEEVLKIASEALRGVLDDLIHKGKIAEDSFILFVNDGSKDRTWELIEEEHQAHPVQVCGVKLAGNVGHQFALTAGLITAMDLSDVTVSIDADLQDDVAVIEEMIDKFHNGCDIVYGVRKERKTDTFFKRFTAQAFYKLMQSVDKDTVYNHADFRMMTNRTLKALMQYPERNLFLRSIVRQLGFREGFVYYDRKAREAGESKYPFTKMLSFSIDGITSFSVAPLRFITFLGLAMTLVAVIMIIFALVEYFQGKTIHGWTSMLVSMWFIGGIITTGVGITGVYIGKIYTEVKRRPRYFIEERV